MTPSRLFIGLDRGGGFPSSKMSLLRQPALHRRGHTLAVRPVVTVRPLHGGSFLLTCYNTPGPQNWRVALTRCAHGQSVENTGSICRRVVTSTLFVCLASTALGFAKVSHAEEVKRSEETMGPSVVDSVFSFFDSEETTKSGRKLPKAYIQNAKEVVRTLRVSLGADAAVFRRNADSAKEAIRTYILNWQGSKNVASEESYLALERALRVLGGFYSKKGPNAVLPEDVRSLVLSDLNQAEAAL